MNDIASPPMPSARQASVNSHNEWDPLEEVVVGVLDGAAHLSWEIAIEAVTPIEHREQSRRYYMAHGGTAIPPEQIRLAQEELDEFVHILESEGVRVRRPDPVNHARALVTPDWSATGGNCQANPRDVLIVFGDEILEAPMSWRCRYFEVFGYRRLLKEYFLSGAKWTAAPKPRLTRETYDHDWKPGETYVTTEHEPVFDAADVVRCGRDIFVQRSHVTNNFGIEWLRRHLGDAYRVHRVEFHDSRAMHIDATFLPIAPGKVIVNPDRPIKALPDIFAKSGWDRLEAPRTTLPAGHPWYHSFRWLSMNVFNLDEKRVIVERRETAMIEALKSWGMEPIPCRFRTNYRFGGSFHCATLDVRRRGELRSYF